jgi:hypothetical protein
MALQQVLNSVTKPALSTSNIVANRALSADPANAGNVQLMQSADRTFMGVALESVSKRGEVAVQTAGIAKMENDGSAVINPFDHVVVAGTSLVAGRVKTQSITAGASNLYNIIGLCVDDAQIPATAGAHVSVLLQPGLVAAN